MNNMIIIFGCGVWGKTACQFYRSRAEILCFVDNKEDLWGKNFDGIQICSPKVLNTYDLSKIGIVIAVRDNWEKIQEQLFIDYGIVESTLFKIEGQSLNWGIKEESFNQNDQEIIVYYTGGIGNQMFQYAFARCFTKMGRRVTGDISEYRTFKGRKFELQSAFRNVTFEECNSKLKTYYENIADCRYGEASTFETGCLNTDMDVFKREKGVFRGYWQNCKYVEMVEKELRHDFEFRNKNDIKLQNVIESVEKKNVVSVHIRRGDYLRANILYGGICTDDYYEAAMQYIMRHEENVIFCFFSDDIEWVKEKYKRDKNAIFVENDMFEAYEDWYDMYMMSECKHNIIANSSFSWWGAWLNKNPNKIVIAPQEWFNGTDMPDICPKSWIRLNNCGEVRGLDEQEV